LLVFPPPQLLAFISCGVLLHGRQAGGNYMRIEEEHEDVLQNIEFAVARLYQSNPDMTDYAVLRTYEALVQTYSAEVTGRPAKPYAAEGIEAKLLHDVKQMCEWRLGRIEMPSAELDDQKLDPTDVPTLVLCLKRLVKSVKMWTKHRGRQGYLNFMSQFVG
jgi:lysyl-tRNA synthetase class II